MLDVITENIDVWSSAQTPKTSGGRGRSKNGEHSAYGIKKLRELILELAVRGKLVPQDSKEEPAILLLEKVAKDKARLVKEGKIKRTKKILQVTKEEIPFKLPNGWEWARINDVGRDWGQKTPENDFSYIEVSAIDNIAGKVRSPSILSASNAPSRARKIVKVGTVIYSTVRPYLQNICVIEEEYLPEPIASTAFAILHPLQEMPGRFFALYFRSPEFVKYVEFVQIGIAYPAINDKQFFGGLVPIPPLPEQYRIVAKVDELMALCDQLEQEQTDNNATHQTLVETLLGTLTASANNKELQENWSRIENHFDTLFSTEYSIGQLKKTILQLTVMGKLVSQDPNDEPASVLLEKIAKEKVRLIKKGKIKKQKTLSIILDDEKTFFLPEGWEWIRIGALGNASESSIVDGPFGSSISTQRDYVNVGVPVTRMSNISPFMYKRENLKYVKPEKFAELNRHNILPGDVLLGKVGSIGNAVIYPSDMDEGMIATTGVARFRVGELITKEYMCYVLNALGPKLRSIANQAVQPFLNMKTINNCIIALPPINEQYNIVTKADELMALCDLLKTKISDAQTTQIQLADVIVEKAVA